MSILTQPAKKMLIKDLKCAEKVEDSDADLHKWKILVDQRVEQKSIPFSVVWLQGHVQKLLPDENGFIIDDSTGCIKVAVSKSVPAGCSQPSLGLYMMVVGELLATGECAVVKAMKIQDLTSSGELVKEFWPAEVLDQHLYGESVPG